MADNELAASEQRRAFVLHNHTSVIGYGRRTAGPSMSIVHYDMDGDDIVCLTMSVLTMSVAVRFTPVSTFHFPSVHPESDGEGGTKEMVHGLGSRLPW